MDAAHQITVGFIVYQPQASFLERLENVVSAGFRVYVYDNSPEMPLVRNFCLNWGEIRYSTAGKNVGLGFGMASICAQAYYEGSASMIFFDQDTVFQLRTLAFIETYYSQNRYLESTHSAVVFAASKSSDLSNATDHDSGLQEVNVAINSGSLFFLGNLKKIGWHNTAYFVDGVDYEFCLNSKKHGLKIGKLTNTPGFDHSAEQADREYKIFDKVLAFRAYPFFRIMDTCKSSLKLFYSALVLMEFRFALTILKFFSVFLVVQFLSRLLKPAK